MNMNFKNFGNERMRMDGGVGSGQPPGNFPLVRQGSIYALTFDELQSTMGSVGKDFGSMNMDELLKSIWNAEETQTMGNNTSGAQDGGVTGGYLQRQGSLTLPRTLSQKTVDDVWKDISKEYNSGFGEAGFQQQQRQQTLGEMTLEEFLFKAGVVREETQVAGKPADNGLFGNLSNSQNNSSFTIGYQQPTRNTEATGNRIPENGNQITFQSTNLPLGVNGIRSGQQQQPQPQQQPQQQQHQQQQQQQQLFPKQPMLTYGPPMAIPTNGQLASPGTRGGIMGLSDPAINGHLVASAALQGGGVGMVNLGGGAVTVANGSPAVSSDGIGKSNGDTSSVSPAPYVFNGVLRGRRCAVEKVVERRQRRMIKNRESAARSRARKQAYTMELEAEVAKLKEQKEELLQKQQEIIEMQKNQMMAMMNMERGAKRHCLRRTQTGPW